MKPLLAVLLILAAGAGIYFSYEQNESFKKTIADRIEMEQSRENWRGERDRMLRELNDARVEYESLTTTKARVEVERDQLIALNQELESTKEALTVELASVDKVIDDLQKQLDSYGVSSVEEIMGKMEASESKNKELQESLAGTKAKGGEISKEVVARTEVLNRLQAEQANYRKTLTKNNADYSIVSVDPQWGFVVIGAGEGSAIDPNTTLLVTRNGRAIGKLKVSSLEKTQTVADIVKGSVPAGIRIQPGDRVQLLSPRETAVQASL